MSRIPRFLFPVNRKVPDILPLVTSNPQVTIICRACRHTRGRSETNNSYMGRVYCGATNTNSIRWLTESFT